MLLGGLWHGAGWNFVLWGGLHGTYLLINHSWLQLTGRVAAANGSLTKLFSTLITFVAVVIAWVPFRAVNLDATLSMLGGMFGTNGISLPVRTGTWLNGNPVSAFIFQGLAPITGTGDLEITAWLLFGLAVVWFMPNTQQWLVNIAPAWDTVTSQSRFMWRPTRRNAVLVGVLFSAGLISLNRTSEFLYFQF